MLADWEISSEVDGKLFAVTVERAPNGKAVIRINGHVAARPMGADETERTISLGGQAYVVSRTGLDTFSLVRDTLADVQARTKETANAVLANAPVAITPSRTSSRTAPMLGWAVIVLAVAGMLYWALPKSYDKLAGERMRQILKEMKVGRNPDFRRAVELWGKAPYSMDLQEMSWASNGFDKWRREKKLYDKAFTEYAVTHSQIIDGTKVPTAIVTFTIDGTEYRVKVVRGAPIAWEE